MLDKASMFFLNMVIEPQVRRFCGPMFFASSNVTPKGTIRGSATFGLVDTGQKKLLVTCWHVVYGEGGFKQIHDEDSDCRFALGIGGRHPHSLSFEDLMKNQVDAERRCDLVTFDISDALDLVAASNLEFFNLKANPPPKVQNGNMIYMIGFPAKGRVENDDSVGHIRQPIGVQASRVGLSNFHASVSNLGLDVTDYGGISGAPCFTITHSSSVRLVGFATGFNGNSSSIMQFTYAHYIGEDGYIRYMI